MVKINIVIILSALLVALSHLFLMFKEVSEAMYDYHNIFMIVLGALIIILSLIKVMK